MDNFLDMLENTEEHALFFEVYLEEWPALLSLTMEEKQRLYTAMREALAALDCPAQGMKVIGDHLHIVLEMSVDRCLQDALDALEETALRTLPDRPGPESCSVYSMSAPDVIDAIIMLAS